MHDRDTLQRFAFESFAVRGQIVHLDKTWDSLLKRHDYPATVRPVLGQIMAATVLLASTLKFDGRMTLQVQGDGPLNLLVAQCMNDLSLRGLARWKSPVVATDFSAQVGNGTLTITIQAESRPEPYQGIVSLGGATFGECLTNYFASSEQLPTRLWLYPGDDSVAGLLLQRLPDTGPSADDDWQRVQLFADTARHDEITALSNEAFLKRLFHQDDLRLFDKRPVVFSCSCSTERIEDMLRSLGEEELKSILAERGQIAVNCEFCNKKHQFDPIDVTRLLSGARDPNGPASLH